MAEIGTLRDEVPGADEYCALRRRAGLSEFSADAACAGLAGSWHAVCVREDGILLAMGRVVGDGGCFFQIVDIAVDPDWQRRGLGLRVMQALVAALRQRAPRGALVSLLADGPARHLYERFGFRPSAPDSIGMMMRL
jgi:ribosomal protein S18 acetylase RimI-like enzyme